MGTTWGLTGPQFLAIHGIVVAGLFILVIVVRSWPQPSQTDPVRLTDEELGHLVDGGQRTLLVALGALRRDGRIEAAPGRTVTVAPGAVARTPTEAALLDAVRRGTAGPELRADSGVVRALAELQNSLAQRGLVNSRARHTLLVVLLVALWAAWVIGVLRVVAGTVQRAPTQDAVLVQVGLLVVLGLFSKAIVRRRHRAGDRLVAEIRRARIEPGADESADHRFGDRVVLAGVAGLPLALVGAGALVMMDPTLASAVAAQRMQSSSDGGGGSYSSSDGGSGDSSSGCGGSSSCGGGCGGGCGSS